MQPHDCTCINELDKLQLADDYAEAIACQLVDDFGSTCVPMLNYVTERLIARIVHVAVLNADQNLSVSERKTLDAVADHLLRLSKTAPAALKIIMDEAARKENPVNASN